MTTEKDVTPTNEEKKDDAVPQITGETPATPPPNADAVQKTNVPAQRAPSIETNETGVMVPKTLDEAYRYACAIAKSGLAPKQFDTPEKIMVGMQYAQELGLPPLTALKSMYIINGVPAIFGDLPLALVRKSQLMEYIEEKQYTDDHTEICKENKNTSALVSYAVCKTKRKDDPTIIERTFSWDEATRAGLDKDKWGDKVTYKNFRKRMLQMRSRTWALKDGFSDVLMGVPIREYDHFGERDITPKKQSLHDKLQGAQNEKTEEKQPQESVAV